MRNVYILFSVLMVMCACTMPDKQSKIHEIKTRKGEGAANANERMQWEQDMLRDPATGAIPKGIRNAELEFGNSLPADNNLHAKSMLPLNYTFRGPNNLGGRTRALAMDVTNENILLAGGVSGGIWRSTNAGLSWTRVTPLTFNPDVISIVQDGRPGHANNWYALSGEAYGTSHSGGSAFYLGNGAYKSIDSGLTWVSLASTASNTPQTFENIWDVAWNLAFDNSNLNQEEVYAATYGAIWRSTDGGNNWAAVKGNTFGNAYGYFSEVKVTPSGVVYATLSSDAPASQRGIWRSTDGVNFTNINPSFMPTAYDRIAIGIDPNNPNKVYFFAHTPNSGFAAVNFINETEYNSLWKYEYLSGNGSGAGGQWDNLSQNLPNPGSTYNGDGVFNGVFTQGGYDIYVRIMPGDSNTVFIGGTNIFRSSSAFQDTLHTQLIGGYAFNAALPFVDEYPAHHPDQHEMIFSPSNQAVCYTSCDGGVYKTLNVYDSVVVWNSLNVGYNVSQFYTVAQDHANASDIIIGGLQDNGTYYTNTTNNLFPWYHSIDGDGSYCAIADQGSTYYFSKQLGKMYKATLNTNGVMTAWERIDPIGGEGYGFINPFVIDPNDNNIMYMAGGKFLWRNDSLQSIALNGGQDTIGQGWTKFPDSLATAGEVITAVAVSTAPANVVYYGTNRKRIFKITNANTGTPTAIALPNTLLPANGYVSCIAIDPSDANKVMIVFSNYSVYSIFYSADGGNTWKKVAGNLEQNFNGAGNGPSCRWATIIPRSDGTAYLVGTSIGLFATNDLDTVGNTTVWTRQAANLIGNAIVPMMDYRASDGNVCIATHGQGIYSVNITSAVQAGLGQMNQHDVAQIYPNPTSDFIYVANLDNDVTVTIYDASGHLIKSTMYNGRIAIADLPRGIYYCTFEKTNIPSKRFLKL